MGWVKSILLLKANILCNGYVTEAKKAKVSQPMIARLERGDQDRTPTLSTINKILAALGYEADLTIRKAA